MIGAQLQAAVYAALSGASVASGRVYDRVPETAAFPYVTIGDEQVVDDSSDCQKGWEVFLDIHCWSRPSAGSKAEVKALAASVVDVVEAITTISGFTLVQILHETSRFLRDPDGLTEHGICTFRALIDPA